ncbi:MAG: hypothetical protein AAGB18_05100 [Pseudomonadota bacterium]
MVKIERCDTAEAALQRKGYYDTLSNWTVALVSEQASIVAADVTMENGTATVGPTTFPLGAGPAIFVIATFKGQTS